MGDFKAYDKNWDTKELPLEIDVMVAEYRQARNKKMQIDILAEQCGTQPCRIAWILDRCGLDVDPRKMPRARRSDEAFDYVAYWESSVDAVICDRIMARLRGLEEDAEKPYEKKQQATVQMEAEMLKFDEKEDEKTVGNCEKEEDIIIRRLEEAVEAEETEGGKRLKYIKPEKEQDPPIEIPAGPLAEVGDHGVYRIVGELWSIYLDKLRERGVVMLGPVEVLKMQDLERIVHEIVEGM